jgi:hypothetical protein
MELKGKATAKQLTNSMEQIPSWESNRPAAIQEILRNLCMQIIFGQQYKSYSS